MIDGLKQKVMAMTPKQKTMSLVMGVPSVLFFIYILVAGNEIVKPVPTSNESEKGMFDTDSQEMTIPALSTKVGSLEAQLATTNQRLSAVAAGQKRTEDLIEGLSGNDASVRSFYEINRQLGQLTDQLNRMQNGAVPIRVTPPSTVVDVVDESKEQEVVESDTTKPQATFIPDEDPIDYRVSRTEIPNDPLAFVEQASNRTSVTQVTDDNVFLSSNGQTARPISSVSSTVIAVDEQAKNEANNSNQPQKYKGKRVLAGAVIPFVLINGFDAPTGRANQTDPVSTTVRITGPALLPNGYSVDLTGCLVTNLVRGNEATERASLRPDRLTCRYSFGDVDIAIQGYASGKDGSAGLRGRLVSKVGKALLYGALAGTAQGLGNAFGGGNSSGRIGQLGGDPFALPSSDQALRSSATAGLSSGSEFLTEYYERKLETLYEIIEIKPLVTGNIHVLTSFELEIIGDPTVAANNTSNR